MTTPTGTRLLAPAPLAPRLAEALNRVTVRADGRQAVVAGRELTAESPRDLRGRLTNALYRELHAGNARTPDASGAAPRRDTRDPALEQRYADGVPHRWAPAEGRLVEIRPDGGHLVVRLPEITARIPVDRLLGPSDPGPGDLVRLAVEAARPALSPGFFYVMGSRPLPRPSGPVRRLFLHLTGPDAAAAHWAAVLGALEAVDAGYHAKVLSDPEDFPRRDALVVYLHGDDGAAERAVTRAVRDLPGRGAEVSLFTDELAPGLAAAWDPADPRPGRRDLSFGQHRCLALATALIDHASEIGTGSLPEQVARAFRQAGIDPLRPAHNTTADPEEN
ncbi:T3SS effector HopA1 family protein [Kitasatospora sp. NPDC087861]|uniref:T3SS effector HopA1 family protein n=1 Tax=Kitasatospora sp. NPDC087861 TaxID=3364070 RepID=UPI00382B7113